MTVDYSDKDEQGKDADSLLRALFTPQQQELEVPPPRPSPTVAEVVDPWDDTPPRQPNSDTSREDHGRQHGFALFPIAATYLNYRDSRRNERSAGGVGYEPFAGFPVGIRPLLLGVHLGLNLAIGGPRFGYDFHAGVGLGFANSWAALDVIADGGGDAINFGPLGPAWYGGAAADLSIRIAEWLRMDGGARRVWRTNDMIEQRVRAGVSFACFWADGRESACWQVSVGGLLMNYPGTDITGFGVMAGITLFLQRVE